MLLGSPTRRCSMFVLLPWCCSLDLLHASVVGVCRRLWRAWPVLTGCWAISKWPPYPRWPATNHISKLITQSHHHQLSCEPNNPRHDQVKDMGIESAKEKEIEKEIKYPGWFPEAIQLWVHMGDAGEVNWSDARVSIQKHLLELLKNRYINCCHQSSSVPHTYCIGTSLMCPH